MKFLKYFGIGKSAKLVPIGSPWETRDVQISDAVLQFKNQGDCSNYPDRYLTLSYEPKQSGFHGYVLPAKAKILSPSQVEKQKYMNALRNFRKGIGQEDVEKTAFISLSGQIFAVVGDDGEDASILRLSKDEFVRVGKVDLKMCGS